MALNTIKYNPPSSGKAQTAPQLTLPILQPLMKGKIIPTIFHI